MVVMLLLLLMAHGCSLCSTIVAVSVNSTTAAKSSERCYVMMSASGTTRGVRGYAKLCCADSVMPARQHASRHLSWRWTAVKLVRVVYCAGAGLSMHGVLSTHMSVNWSLEMILPASSSEQLPVNCKLGLNHV